MPEGLKVVAQDELLHIKPRPADRQAPENGVNLLDELAHIYTRMCLASDKTDVLIIGSAPLRVAGQLPSKLACPCG
jgi:hypothetical protein